METMEEQWRWLYSEEGSPHRKEWTALLSLLFSDGHKRGIRRGAAIIGKRFTKGGYFLREDRTGLMNTIHPAALNLLATYGVYYTPLVWARPLPEPRENECFQNSRVLALANKGLCYAEGIVIGVLVRPMHHAWNVEGLNGAFAVDWTHYLVCEWSRYLGIPFTLQEHARIREAARIGRKTAPIFSREFFTPEVERTLLSILKRRRRRVSS